MTADHPYEVDGIEDLRIGPEVEWAAAEGREPTLRDRAADSGPVKEALEMEYGHDFRAAGIRTHIGLDNTVGNGGLELNPTEPIEGGEEALDWFERTIDLVQRETGTGYEPVGLVQEAYGATAGLHLHLSPLSTEKARELWEMSHEPWMQAFTGTSIVDGPVEARVFRGGQYCKMSNFGHGGHAVAERGGSHYEWRLPEPMLPEHFSHLMTLLDRWLQQGRDSAREYALALLQQDDSPVTAVRRAEAVGLGPQLQDAVQVTLDRTPHPDTVEFYSTVTSLNAAPYTFRATTPDGEWYFCYSFEGADTEAEVEDFGITVQHGTILDAESLEPVDDDEMRDDFIDALDNVGVVNPFGTDADPTSEVTDFLLDTAFEE